MIFPQLLSKGLEKLYEYDWARTLKEHIRPIKHSLFGKNDIYLVVDELKSARDSARPVKIIFDVGAAVGDKTVTFLKSFPDATVYCFEPQKESAERLKRRTKRWQKRVKLFEIGLWREEGVKEMQVLPYRDASSFIRLPRQVFDQIPNIASRDINLKTMDGFVAEQKIEKIDLVKIDVEGAEKEVLEGGRNAFRDKIENVFIEIDPWRKNIDLRLPYLIEVFSFFHEAGFRFVGHYGDYFFSKDEDILKKHFTE